MEGEYVSFSEPYLAASEPSEEGKPTYNIKLSKDMIIAVDKDTFERELKRTDREHLFTVLGNQVARKDGGKVVVFGRFVPENLCGTEFYLIMWEGANGKDQIHP